MVFVNLVILLKRIVFSRVVQLSSTVFLMLVCSTDTLFQQPETPMNDKGLWFAENIQTC